MTAQEQRDEPIRTPAEGEQPLSGSDFGAKQETTSAQEQHVQDDQQRAQQQDPGQHANPNQPPRPSDERDGTVGRDIVRCGSYGSGCRRTLAER